MYTLGVYAGGMDSPSRDAAQRLRDTMDNGEPPDLDDIVTVTDTIEQLRMIPCHYHAPLFVNGCENCDDFDPGMIAAELVRLRSLELRCYRAAGTLDSPALDVVESVARTLLDPPDPRTVVVL